VASSSFLMGSPESDPDRTDFEIPQSTVSLTYGYWIAKFEVTQEQYEALTGANPSAATDSPKLPVDSVTWQEAVDFCSLLTEQERKAGRLPAGYAYRLPTEAEWELAARAGKTTRFSYGDDIGYLSLPNYAWTVENSGDTTHPVGTKSANAWGLFDMHGNVAEWCQDWFGTYAPEDKINPVGPATGSDKVFRGGSWGDPAGSSRVSARGGLNPASRLSSFGFRAVLAPVRL
jgi:formylglycine-generating enzyme required for sulfatase activity